MSLANEVRNRFKESKLFTINEVKIFLSTKKVSDRYFQLIIHNLLKTGELKRISRGIYTFQDEIETVGFAFQPFYYGLQESLSLRNLWEQEVNPIVVTPRKVRTGIRNFQGANYVVKRIRRSMFFGFETIKYKEFWIPVSDIEKTVIDFVYFKEHLNEETLIDIRQQIDEKKLKLYLKRCPNWVRNRVEKLLKCQCF